MSDEKQPKPCTITLEDGTHYDLSSLSSAAKDYEQEVAIGEHTTKYLLNVCRNVVTEVWHIDEPSKVGGFFARPDEKGSFSIGEFSSNLTISPSTSNPMLIYEHGSACPGNDKELASTAIRFICDPSEFGAGQPQLVASIPQGPDACHFFFEWKTHVACPTNEKLSLEVGHALAYIVFIGIAILTWFVGQTLYNRFHLGRRGMAQFPIPGFSCGCPASNNNTEQPPRRGWGLNRGRRSQRGYNHLATEPDEEDSLAAARFSLTDDEDEDDARALGGEVDAWRGTGYRRSQELGAMGGDGERVGAHQGLVNL